MNRLLFIYNPKAGRQKARFALSDYLEEFASHGFETTVHPTCGRGDAAATAKRLGPRFDRLVCCGGDGTLNETVSGLMELPPEQRPMLGYIPTGSTNDFARTLELPKTTRELARTACTGTPRDIDLGWSEGRYFTYVSAFGLFTDVSYSTPQNSKNLLGHFAYVLAGAGSLFNIPSYHMTVTTDDGSVHEGDYIYGMVSNTLSVGGVLQLPRNQVDLHDGLFEVMLLRPPQNAKDWQGLLAALNSQQFEADDPVSFFTAREVTFRCDRPVAWTVDGEFGSKQETTVIKCLPRGITIAYTPPEEK